MTTLVAREGGKVVPVPPKRRKLATYAGLAFSTLAIFNALSPGLDSGFAFLTATTIACGGLAASLGWSQGLGKKFWIACLLAFLLTLASIFTVSTIYYRLGLTIVALASIVSMLSAFRVNSIGYLPLIFGFTAISGTVSSSPWIAVAALLVISSVLIICNYMVQMVMEHWPEVAKLRSLFGRSKFGRIAINSMIVWAVAVGLSVVGFYIHETVETALRIAVYDQKVVIPDPQDQRPVEERSIEGDLLYMTELQKSARIEKFEQDVRQLDASGTAAISAVPNDVDSFIKVLKPSRIDENAACAGAKVKVWKFRIGLAGICRGMLNSVNNSIDRSFENARAKTRARLEAKSSEWKSDGKKALEDARAVGVAEISDFHANQRSSITITFLTLRVLTYFGYFILVCSLISAFFYVLGRVMFDQSSVPFQISSTKVTSKVTSKTFEKVDLAYYKLYDQTVWYVSRNGISCGGDGTAENLSIPFPHQCMVPRIFGGQWALNKITVKPTVVNDTPYISCDNHEKLIVIAVTPDMEMSFRMRNLVGFSKGIELKSVYSTHVGAHFLGLGSFHAFATGDGFLILRVSGKVATAATKGDIFPYYRLLAWERGHEFSLSQNLSVFGVWLNQPSLILQSPTGAAILDEYAPGAISIWKRLRRLLRYLILPF